MRALIFALLLLALTTGCGTLRNLNKSVYDTNGTDYFGGVYSDLDSFIAIGSTLNNPKGGIIMLPVITAICTFPLADIPISFVGDVLTLPVVAQKKSNQKRFLPYESVLTSGHASQENDKSLGKKLMNASCSGDIPTVEYLLTKVDVNFSTEKGTPLIAAAVYGHEDLVKILIDCGADLNIKNTRGNTALFGAIRFGHKKIVEILINNGANLNLKNDAGYTALSFAKKYQVHKIVRLLHENGAK